MAKYSKVLRTLRREGWGVASSDKSKKEIWGSLTPFRRSCQKMEFEENISVFAKGCFVKRFGGGFLKIFMK